MTTPDEQTPVPQEIWDGKFREEWTDEQRTERLRSLVASVAPEHADAVVQALHDDPDIHIHVLPRLLDTSAWSEHILHQASLHPDYDYEMTETERKGPSKEPEDDGKGPWEPNCIVPVEEWEDGERKSVLAWRNWERHDFTEIEHWRRRKTL